jgi:3-carboxy-cis,cis-muconate cycloisomerase
MSALWDSIFGATVVAAATDDQAWLQALCDTEAALAIACRSVGLVDASVADAVVQVCTRVAADGPGALGPESAADGNPVIPLVRRLRDRAQEAYGPSVAAAVHLGATSQDILDTAAMLVARNALVVILAAVEDASAACTSLVRTHRDTAMIGRTLMQQAIPTTFGAVAAGWGDGLDLALRRLSLTRDGLAVQLGGAAGTLAGWHPHGAAVRAALAGQLGLVDPGTVWHTERSRIAVLAADLGVSCGTFGKVATDIVLLSQDEVGELRERSGGGSSTMPHKHNPIAAITARAAAAQAPGLVATVLGAMPAELQRGAGPWHAEWLPLTALLTAAGGAATRLAESLAGLQVCTDAMVRNLAGTDVPPTGAAEIAAAYLARHTP